MIRHLLARMPEGPLMRFVWRVHPSVYRATGGLLGRRMGFGLPVLLLETTGRRTGQRRTTSACYLADGSSYAVIASRVGNEKDPAWILNLRAHPDATVHIGRRRIAVTAREAEGQERDRLWTAMAARYPGYDRYRERTSRRIPVVVLEPRER
ncbi:MAG: nitroreductase family deazaflavin-dependent oxidoreductase [Actinomycetota bacterium]